MTARIPQFIKDWPGPDRSIGRPDAPKYPIGAQVHDANERPGIITAHHVDYKHYNVQFGRGNVDVLHEDDLH